MTHDTLYKPDGFLRLCHADLLVKGKLPWMQDPVGSNPAWARCWGEFITEWFRG